MWTGAFTLWSIRMDRIQIRELLARCIIGINDEERVEKQDVIINLAIFLDLQPAGQTDNFECTVDYRELKKKILAMVENSGFYLIEALAEAIANLCLDNPMIKKVMVNVEKPSALRFAKSVGVVIVRQKEKD